MSWSVVFYRTSSGCPFESFLDSLPGRAAKKITWILAAVEELDCAAELFFQKTEEREDIRECRVACEDAVFRIFAFLYNKDVIVLGGGVLVKFQDMRKEQLGRAVRYKEDFLLRGRTA